MANDVNNIICTIDEPNIHNTDMFFTPKKLLKGR